MRRFLTAALCCVFAGCCPADPNPFECRSAADCPPPDVRCLRAVCEDNVCDYQPEEPCDH